MQLNLKNSQWKMISDREAVLMCKQNNWLTVSEHGSVPRRHFIYLNCTGTTEDAEPWTPTDKIVDMSYLGCYQIDCDPDQLPLNKKGIDMVGTSLHETPIRFNVEFNCHDDKVRPVPGNSTVCLPSGEWSSPMPTCSPPVPVLVKCPHPEVKYSTTEESGASVTDLPTIPSDGHYPQTQLVWKCDKGFTMDTGATHFAQNCNGRTGKWEPPVRKMPKCRRIRCFFLKSMHPKEANCVVHPPNPESVTFHLNDQVKFQCKNETYYHDGGNATWTCTERSTWDNWDGTPFMCKKVLPKNCSDLPFPPIYNSVSLRISETYAVGECDHHYQLASSQSDKEHRTKFSITCESGSWERIQCIKIRCSNLSHILQSSGQIIRDFSDSECNGDDFAVGSCINFRCLNDHQIKTRGALCLPNGQWSSQPGGCQPKLPNDEQNEIEHCRERIGMQLTGVNSLWKMISDREAVVTCKQNDRLTVSGYDSVPRRHFIYLNCTGTTADAEPWTPTDKIVDMSYLGCHQIECDSDLLDSPKLVKNNVKTTIDSFGETPIGLNVGFECYDEEVQPVPGNSVVCLPSGEWSYPIPSCPEPVKCPHPEVQYSSVINLRTIPSDGHEPDTQLVWKCDKGFAMDGRVYFIQECNGLTGKWEPSLRKMPRCKRIECPFRKNMQPKSANSVAHPPHPESVTFHLTDQVTFQCKNGSYYHYNGNATWTCTERGTWDNWKGTPFTCRPVIRVCILPKEAAKKTVLWPGQKITVKACRRAFRRSTSRERTTLTCLEDGTINPPYEHCRPVTCPKPKSSQRCTIELPYSEVPFPFKFYTSYKVGKASGTASCSSKGIWTLKGPPCDGFPSG